MARRLPSARPGSVRLASEVHRPRVRNPVRDPTRFKNLFGMNRQLVPPLSSFRWDGSRRRRRGHSAGNEHWTVSGAAREIRRQHGFGRDAKSIVSDRGGLALKEAGEFGHVGRPNGYQFRGTPFANVALRLRKTHARQVFAGKVVPQEGFEPPTPSLRMRCSTS